MEQESQAQVPHQQPQEQTGDVRQHSGRRPPAYNEKEQSQRKASLSLAEISALVTVLAASIYTLGLIAFLVPIYRIYTQDFSTALYATSQVPRTIIVGQGIRSLVGPWLLLTVVLLGYALFAWSFLARFELRGWARRFLQRIYSPSLGLTLIGAIAPTFVLAFSDADTAAIDSAIRKAGSPTLGDFIFWWALLSFLSGLAGRKAARFLEEGVTEQEERRTFLGDYSIPRIQNNSLVIRGIMMCFVVALLASLPAAALSNSPLPSVKVTGKNASTCGDLLTHSDGFWHLFESGEAIVAVPDDEVTEVEVTRSSTSCS